MKIRHLQSATQVIELGGIRILTDPWLTEGEYLGSWFHYPPFPDDEIDLLDYDFIYVSHIHPDHVSDKTFHRLPKKVPVLIFDYASKFLKAKIERLGFDVIECQHGDARRLSDSASITVYAADDCNPEFCGKYIGCANLETAFGQTQIDTLAVFDDDGQRVINLNDCPFELAQHVLRRHLLDEHPVDLLLHGYAGAGPLPQCFEFATKSESQAAAKAKEQKFLEQAVNYVDLMKPRMFAPFAGTYVLGSRLSALNNNRGVPSLSDAVSFIQERITVESKGILLEPFDELTVASGHLKKSSRTPGLTQDTYLSQISQQPLDYDHDSWDDSELIGLLDQAHQRFSTKASEIGLRNAPPVVVQTSRVAYEVTLDCSPKEVPLQGERAEPFLRITLDHNLLHRLLRGPRYAHWNNAEIGSHLHWEWRPHNFDRGLQHCLYFLHA